MRHTLLRPLTLPALACIVLALAGCSSGGSSGGGVLVPGDVDLGQFEWLMGHWQSQDGDLVREEHWIQPSGGTMLGLSRELKDGQTIFFEYLRIERRRDGLYLIAQPCGGEATAFRLAGTSARRAGFTNLENEFPQRITYWRDGSRLSARVEGMRDGQPVVAQVEWVKSSLPGE